MNSPIRTTEFHPEYGITEVLTTTYKSGAYKGIVSKKYLDAKTRLPFEVIWLNPQGQEVPVGEIPKKPDSK